MLDSEVPPILNAADLMRPPSKNVLKVIQKNFTQFRNDFVTFTALPETAVLMSKLTTKNEAKLLDSDKAVALLFQSAIHDHKAFRKIMETNDQLFLHVIKRISSEDLKYLIYNKVFTPKELIVLAKKHIPWVAERGHWVRKNYGEEIIGKFVSENGDPKYKPNDKEYGLNYLVENGRRAWIEKNYGTEAAKKMLEQYEDRVPDSVDFVEEIVDKINEVVTNNFLTDHSIS